MSDDEVPAVTVGDVDELDDPLVLDIRETDEWEAGHAPDSVFHPMGTIPDVWPGLPTDRPVLVVCRTGARSARVTAYLRQQGIDAVNLDGGLQAWAGFGLDIVRDDGSYGTVI